jgi:hypothetical protein
VKFFLRIFSDERKRKLQFEKISKSFGAQHHAGSIPVPRTVRVRNLKSEKNLGKNPNIFPFSGRKNMPKVL